MKTILMKVTVPDDVEFKIDSFDYGFNEINNGIERYVSYKIPVTIITPPTETDLVEKAMGFKNPGDCILCMEWTLKQIGL